MRKILKPFSRFLARFYWAFIKEEIDELPRRDIRTKLKFLGEKVVFKGRGDIFHAENISIGNFVKIGENYVLMGIGGIEIGDGAQIGMNVVIHSGNHSFRSAEMIPFDKGYELGKTTIGKGVWLGTNVNILPGVTIGDGAIIGMGTTVSKNVNPYEIVVGAGQRVIGHRDGERFQQGLENNDYFGKHYH